MFRIHKLDIFCKEKIRNIKKYYTLFLIQFYFISKYKNISYDGLLSPISQY